PGRFPNPLPTGNKTKNQEGPYEIWPEQPEVVGSCIQNVSQLIEVPTLFPLSDRKTYKYSTSGTVIETLPNGLQNDFFRNIDVTEIQSDLYKEGSQPASSKVTITYDGVPYKTANRSVFHGQDGLSRTKVTEW